ncbi:ATP-binding protein [Desulfomicrobium sp. ZS1]|uniref:PAS domain-containing sensor histidine kinase n=1 Tax=Desulfomicrobium sp. ZS1 TaxID=2952228 RepID=UPI0020B1DB8A|nr:PAS domain-containing sensor histidine kinase [Desulfomicrobium sp. ZS1]UTF51185.1 ATP-binding protein [Desulfomicrobium sp. ZS1]
MKIILYLCICIKFFFICNIVFALNNQINVVILHSYHKGFGWTDTLDESIRSNLSKIFSNIQFVTEYMDSKRHSDGDYIESLANLYFVKYNNDKPSVVIVTDDDAFNFLRIHGQKIFGKIPIVFCGVNFFQDEMLDDLDNFSGVVETIDVHSTLSAALLLHPRARNVAIVVDRTPTGRHTSMLLSDFSPALEKKIKFIMLDELSMHELLEKIKTLPQDSVVLLLNFNRDAEGRVFSHLETIKLLREATALPIYGVWDFFLGEGIVGGMITSGKEQGAAAAAIALRIINGQTPKEVGVNKQSPNQWMFDYKELKRLGLNETRLPLDSLVLNRPPSFYEINKKIIWSLVAVVLFLTVVTAVMALNILQRRRVQAELRDTAEKLSNLLEALPIVPFTTTPEPMGRFTYVSQNVINITGFKPEDFLKDKNFWRRLIHPDDIGAVMDRVDKALHVQKEKEIGLDDERLTYRFQTLRGDYRWFSDVRRVVNYPESQVRRVAGFWQDITDEVELRQETERSLQQVIQADKLASLGELVAGVAHEIRNPNVFISTNVPLLRETWEILEPLLRRAETEGWDLGAGNMSVAELSKDMDEMLNDIMVGSERIDRVVRELRDFASSSERSQPQAVQLNDVVKKTLSLVGAQIRKKFKKFTLELDPNLPLAEGFPSKLEQVIANLVVNATHAVRPEVESVLQISTRRLENPQAVILQVLDNGHGIAPELREKIFEPFFTTRREKGGTGLGLSVSYRLANDHNGVIFPVSRPGLGTCFTMALPLHLDRCLRMRPGLIWMDRDETRLERLAHVSQGPPALELIGVRSLGELPGMLSEHPNIVAACVDYGAFEAEMQDVLRFFADSAPLLVRTVYSENMAERVTRHVSGSLVDFVVSGPPDVDLLRRIMRLNVAQTDAGPTNYGR